METPKPTAEHIWLQQLVGEWTFESECDMGPGNPPMKSKGTESVRSLGGLWTIGHGQGSSPCGEEIHHMIMTLGYDPAGQRFVGTFIASMMTYLWQYSGKLDQTTNTLTLDADGPKFSGEPGLDHYQDIITIVSPNHRTLSSQIQLPDGTWQKFMKADYRRVS